jgi:HK97 family phage major capsid protein
VPYSSIIDRTGADSLIPIEYANEIIQTLPQESLAMSLCRKVTMGAKQQRLPVIATLPMAYWVNGDTGLKQTSSMGWTNEVLDAQEIAVIVPIPEAVLDDAAFDIWGEVRPRITEAIGKVLDLAALFGVNAPTGWPVGGVRKDALNAGQSIVQGVVPARDIPGDLNLLQGMIEEQGFFPSAYAAYPTLRTSLRGLRATTGETIYAPALTADSPDMIWGLPTRFSRNGGWVPTGNGGAVAMVGDWRYAILGIRQDITMKLLSESVISDAAGVVILNLAQQDAVALRVVFRAGFAIANPVTAMKASGTSAFAVLAPAGSTPAILRDGDSE